MPIVVTTNIASMEAQRNLASIQNRLVGNFQRLSSGLRINSAADDAAGLSVSESLKMQESGYAVAERNANNGISLAQTADGALAMVSQLIGRMRDLSVQASNGDLTTTDRTYLNTEYSALMSEISRVANSTRFNNLQLINGGGTPIDFQIGIGTNSSDRINVNLQAVNVKNGTLFATTNIATTTTAQTSITELDNALATVNTHRETFGALTNRLQVTIGSVQTMRTNLAAARSRISDVDVAEETASLTRNQVLAQAGASVLAQANQAPQIALSLLR